MILCCHRLVLKLDNHRSKFVILHHYQTTCKKFYAEHSYKCGNTFSLIPLQYHSQLGKYINTIHIGYILIDEVFPLL